MNMPGFIAEAAIYKSTRNYVMMAAGAAAMRGVRITPQQLSPFVPLRDFWSDLFLRSCRRSCFPEYANCVLPGPSCDYCGRLCADLCDVPGLTEGERYSCEITCRVRCVDACQELHYELCRAQYDECVSNCQAVQVSKLIEGPTLAPGAERFPRINF